MTPGHEHAGQYEVLQVLELHDWPERAVGGPSIVVWYGSSESEAVAVCEELERKRGERGSPIHYEVHRDG